MTKARLIYLAAVACLCVYWLGIAVPKLGFADGND